MEEQIANWLDNHKKAVVIALTVVASTMSISAGACAGMLYCKTTCNKMLRYCYRNGLLKVFNKAGEEITSQNRRYFYTILP